MRGGIRRWLSFGVSLGIVLMSWSLSQAQIRIPYDSSVLEAWLDRLPDAGRWYLVRHGMGDSVKVGGKWHTRFCLPLEKIWNESLSTPFMALPSDTIETNWWTTGGRDLFPVIKDSITLDPDTLKYVELTYSKKKRRIRVVVKRKRLGIIKLRGIASKQRADKHLKQWLKKHRKRKIHEHGIVGRRIKMK